MTPQQISQAVACYIRMRQIVTAANGGPGAGVTVTLAATRTWSVAQVWRQVWWLFFYSGMKTKFANPRANAARAGGWFDKHATFANANTHSTHNWHVAPITGERSFTPVGAEAILFCSKAPPYHTMPYRTGAVILHRINRLADFFLMLEAAAKKSGCSFVDELAGGNAQAATALQTALDKLTPITGPITAVHCLSDLGFPCCKPDIWMCRIPILCGWLTGYTPAQIAQNRRGGWQALWTDCQTIAVAANSILHEPNPLRAFDWYVANYGMLHTPKSCPCPRLLSGSLNPPGDGGESPRQL